MNPRNTKKGLVLEQMILPALKQGGYQCRTHVHIGQRLDGKRHIIDVLAQDAQENQWLILLKWQQVASTAEEEVPFKFLCLVDAVRSSEGKYRKAYLVLGGDGWTLRDFFIGDGLKQIMNYSNLVDVVTLETFVGLANQGKL